MHAFPFLALALLLGATPAVRAQTKPGKAPSTAALTAANTLDARIRQYQTDYTQRLRTIYEAPSDGRAIGLLSTATEEFGARRKALRLELVHAQQSLSPTEYQALLRGLNAAAWQEAQQAILRTPAAAKMPARAVRNPALETALQRFNDARLAELRPDAR